FYVNFKGKSTNPGDTGKSIKTPLSMEAKKHIAVNKYNLIKPEADHVGLIFRERCYETLLQTLQSIFQGNHRSLTLAYFERLLDMNKIENIDIKDRFGYNIYLFIYL